MGILGKVEKWCSSLELKTILKIAGSDNIMSLKDFIDTDVKKFRKSPRDKKIIDLTHEEKATYYGT